jgi:aryl-alcohol dehydrogenase-like predicted oxidoreductase
MTLPTRPLGLNGPPVSAIGLGAMSIGGAYGQKNTLEERLSFFDRAYEIGERFWDTADVYLDAEDTIGKWFQRSGKRDGVFLATKFGLDYSTMKEVVRSDPEYVVQACERSLERLGVECIDLYYWFVGPGVMWGNYADGVIVIALI